MELNQVNTEAAMQGGPAPPQVKKIWSIEKCTHEHWWAERGRNRRLSQQWIWAWRDVVEEIGGFSIMHLSKKNLRGGNFHLLLNIID